MLGVPQVVIVLTWPRSNEGKLFSRIPLAFERMLGNRHDWCYRTVYVLYTTMPRRANTLRYIYCSPQRNLEGRTVEMPGGKLLGGTR